MSLSRSLAVVFTLTVAFWSCAAVSASAQTAPLPDSPTLDGPIALIPCVNLSGQLADEWVGDGITAALSADLTQRSLLVVGHQVGATWLVSGAFQHLGSDLRIIARVIDVRAGDIVYTHKLDGSMHDLFGLQDRIGDALERRFSGSPESGMPPSTQDRAMVPNEAPLPEGVLGANGVTGTLTLTAPEGVETSRRQRPAAGAGFMRPPLAGGPHTVAVRTSRPPVIDGRLDDSVWSEATHITEFVQMTPLEGAPGTELTEVWIAYDRNNLYFGLYAHYSDPGIIRANRSDRDETGGDDTMSVMFDPFLDQQRAYQFSVNGYGIQADAIVNAGRILEFDFRRQGRRLGYSVSHSRIDPDFRTSTGFVPRVDIQQTIATGSYKWWPEAALINWGPTVTYLRNYDHAGVLEDEHVQGQVDLEFQRNVRFAGTFNRTLERFGGIDFRKTGYSVYGVVSGRIVSVVASANWGDGVFFSDNPFLGRSTGGNLLVLVRPTSRLRTEFRAIFSQFVDPSDDAEVFDVKIYRSRSTYQFTERLLLRHILEHNTSSRTLGNNVLLTYRINTGTVAFVGYDDRYQQGSSINGAMFPTTSQFERTNRAFFTKLSYLFRY